MCMCVCRSVNRMEQQRRRRRFTTPTPAIVLVLVVTAVVAMCSAVSLVAGEEMFPVLRVEYGDDSCPDSTGTHESRLVWSGRCTPLPAVNTSIFVKCDIRSGSSAWTATEYASANCTAGTERDPYTPHGRDETKCDNATLPRVTTPATPGITFSVVAQRVQCGVDCSDATTCEQCNSWAGFSVRPLRPVRA